jgi:hypothetical protein
MVISIFALIISLIALLIAFLTFYYSRIKPGIVKMTKPTVIFFGSDGVRMENKEHKKVFIRTLLYSTSDKGQYIQNMHIRLQRNESSQNFNVWVYGETQLVRGSGLFVGKDGVATNHHFLMPRDKSAYEFLPGDYTLEVFVETINKPSFKIFEQKLSISKTLYNELGEKATGGIFFDWAPNSQSYYPHVDGEPRKPHVEKYLY